jgi:integrase
MIGYNTTIKYLQNFKRVFLIGVKNGWVQSDPFAGFKLNLEETDRTYLTEDELQNIMGLEILIPRLELVRDIFIFSCFSGLAYSDIFKLKGSELERDPNGTLWVKTRRQKTKVKSQIPLLNVPKAIIEKYCDLSILTAESKVLPVFSNQKLNAYLKEIQMMARLEKNLTFHVARHTFATTVTMTNGVPIESVAKMMGHKNIKTTQHYARIVDSKINNDMIDLANRIGTKFSFAV